MAMNEIDEISVSNAHSGARTAAGVPHTQVHDYLRRTLETAQDVVIVLLMILLVGITARALGQLFHMAFLRETEFPIVLSQVVFILILTELYRTLIFYLREHRVSVTLMVEVAIVSILQDLILKSAHEFEWLRVIGSAVLLVVLGGLLAMQRFAARAHNDPSEISAH